MWLERRESYHLPRCRGRGRAETSQSAEYFLVIPTEPDIKLGQHLVKGRIVLMWWCESGTVSATFVLFCVYSPTRAGLNAARCIKPRPNDRNMPHNMSQHCWAPHVECVWPPCCDMLQHVGCCWLKFETGQI